MTQQGDFRFKPCSRGSKWRFSLKKFYNRIFVQALLSQIGPNVKDEKLSSALMESILENYFQVLN